MRERERRASQWSVCKQRTWFNEISKLNLDDLKATLIGMHQHISIRNRRFCRKHKSMAINTRLLWTPQNKWVLFLSSTFVWYRWMKHSHTHQHIAYQSQIQFVQCRYKNWHTFYGKYPFIFKWNFQQRTSGEERHSNTKSNIQNLYYRFPIKNEKNMFSSQLHTHTHRMLRHRLQHFQFRPNLYMFLVEIDGNEDNMCDACLR